MAHHRAVWKAVLCVLALLAGREAHAYAVLAHEAIIDTAWDTDIRPLLLGRFPGASAEDLRHAHAYAYGGCIIQDMGYYPFGSKLFTDLAHYVRSGDFIVNLIRESQDINEYAFALGALEHYAADTIGHKVAVNPAVAIEYPKLETRYGRTVTYADNPTAHLKVEFGFDVLQVAQGHYAATAYHDFIGFGVAKPLLERAFRDTYSLELTDIFSDLDRALSSYRFAVGRVIPEMTKVAWRLKKNELRKADSGLTRRKFVYALSRRSYRKEWDGKYDTPGTGAVFLAWVIRILPKVGPLRALDFKAPTAQTERLFAESFERTLAEYRTLLAGAGWQSLALENRDFDTGGPVRPGEYRLADQAYSKLAIRLARKDPASVDRKVVDNVLAFYRDLNLPYATKDNPADWSETIAAISKLEAIAPVAPVPASAERSSAEK
ncbi:MAG: hypothetical protein C5B51_24580 [Terriglobia bacterium]|nr:MAG: hypothetical protein C5B51_24580 [Terriglobia bacterium]